MMTRSKAIGWTYGVRGLWSKRVILRTVERRVELLPGGISRIRYADRPMDTDDLQRIELPPDLGVAIVRGYLVPLIWRFGEWRLMRPADLQHPMTPSPQGRRLAEAA
jgi:hypothetical protein